MYLLGWTRTISQISFTFQTPIGITNIDIQRLWRLFTFFDNYSIEQGKKMNYFQGYLQILRGTCQILCGRTVYYKKSSLFSAEMRTFKMEQPFTLKKVHFSPRWWELLKWNNRLLWKKFTFLCGDENFQNGTCTFFENTPRNGEFFPWNMYVFSNYSAEHDIYSVEKMDFSLFLHFSPRNYLTFFAEHYISIISFSFGYNLRIVW